MRQKTHSWRGYTNTKERCVMIWHSSLRCWVFTFINNNGSVSKTKKQLSSFNTEKTKAIAAVRGQQYEDGKSRNESLVGRGKKKTHIYKLPQEGWESFTAKTKGISTWDDLAAYVWKTFNS